MLHIYFRELFDREENIIIDSEVAFRLITLRGTNLERTLISEIEQGSYVDSAFFIDRFGYKLPISELSTGCKTALVVANSPDRVVDLAECGNNARDAIIRNVKNGRILLSYNGVDIFYSGDGDVEVDLCAEDVYRFTSLWRFNYYLNHEFPAYSPADTGIDGVTKLGG